MQWSSQSKKKKRKKRNPTHKTYNKASPSEVTQKADLFS